MTEESKANTIVLGIKDRFMVRELLPRRANLTDQILAQDIDEKVVINQEDAKAIGLKSGDAGVSWKDDATLDKTVEFSSAELELLDRQIKRMSSEGEINRDMVNTILKIQKLIKA